MGYDVYFYNKLENAPTPEQEEERIKKAWSEAPTNENGEKIIKREDALYNLYEDQISHGEEWSILEYFEKDGEITCGVEYPIAHEKLRKFYNDIGYELSVKDQRALCSLLESKKPLWMVHSW